MKNRNGFNLINIVLQTIKISRPVHWIKNFALFAAILFSGDLFNQEQLTKVIIAFIVFSLATSATYIFNDIIDARLDRLHPIKKFRPIASGELPAVLAMLESATLSFVAIFLASKFDYLFFVSVLSYLAIQIAYSLFLKNLPIIDILTIASGFILRVYAGAFVINAHLSVWFLLCVISVALFLASGKRRAELNIIDQTQSLTRKTLSKYKKELLNSYVTMFGNASWMSWALFTFFESPKASLPVWLYLAEISRTTTINKLMMITIPIVIFGIMQYENLIFEGKTEAPEKLLLTNKALITSVVLWVIAVIWLIYSGVSVQGL